MPKPLTLVEQELSHKKAQDIVSISLEKSALVNHLADHLVIASGRSTRHVGALADHLVFTLKKAGLSATLEGRTHCHWVLIDSGDIIIHLFHPPVRAFYDLESLWSKT